MFPWLEVLRVQLEWTARLVTAATPRMLPWVLLIGVPAGLILGGLAERRRARRLRTLARWDAGRAHAAPRRRGNPEPFSASEQTDQHQLPETVGPRRQDPGPSGIELFGPPLPKREKFPE